MRSLITPSEPYKDTLFISIWLTRQCLFTCSLPILSVLPALVNKTGGNEQKKPDSLHHRASFIPYVILHRSRDLRL